MAMTDKELFAQAINEGVLSRMELEKAEFCGKVTCSDEHYRRMRGILGFKVGRLIDERKKIKRAVAIALIAAALLLAGCTAIAYRDKIGDFFVEIFDTHIKGSFSEEEAENDRIIEEYYTLTYIPEGYSEIMEIENNTIVMRKFENENHDTIKFEQVVLKSLDHYIDAEHGEIDELMLSNFSVFYYSTSDTHMYVWNNEKYAFLIETTDELVKDEIQNIINGVSTIQN